MTRSLNWWSVVNESNRDLNLGLILKHIESKVPYEKIGKILASRGMVYEASVPRAVLGSNVEFVAENGERSLGEVVAIKGANCMVMPYDEISGINSETKIHLKDIVTEIKVSPNMLGRVVDFQEILSTERARLVDLTRNARFSVYPLIH